jgi:hypothetical protein
VGEAICVSGGLEAQPANKAARHVHTPAHCKVVFQVDGALTSVMLSLQGVLVGSAGILCLIFGRLQAQVFLKGIQL